MHTSTTLKEFLDTSWDFSKSYFFALLWGGVTRRPSLRGWGRITINLARNSEAQPQNNPRDAPLSRKWHLGAATGWQT